MSIKVFLFEALIALIGGFLGASISALGSFLIFGLLGLVGFLYLMILHDDTLIKSITSGVLFLPHVSFVGGAIAAAYARKEGIIECGKDIGRSFISLQRFDILWVGALAGLAGYIVNAIFSFIFRGAIESVALTVVTVPLVVKYWWGLTKTNDCDGTSHAVPSPFRFFEKLNQPIGKIVLTAVIGFIATLLAITVSQNLDTAAYAEVLLFFISATSLYLLFMKIPLPATHHLAASGGAVVIAWLSRNEFADIWGNLSILMGWGISFSFVAMSAADYMKMLLFDEGDIHIDPPAMGIVIATALGVGLFPAIKVYNAPIPIQMILSLLLSVGAIILSLKKLGEE